MKNNQIEDFIKEGKYFSTDELKNRIAKMDINELDYQHHDRKHYIDIYDRMILIKENRDLLSFYLKIDPLIFQKKTRKRSPERNVKENAKNEGKLTKKDTSNDKEEKKESNHLIPSDILQQLIPSKPPNNMNKKHLEVIDLTSNKDNIKVNINSYVDINESNKDVKQVEVPFYFKNKLENLTEKTRKEEKRQDFIFNKSKGEVVEQTKELKNIIKNNLGNEFFLDKFQQNSYTSSNQNNSNFNNKLVNEKKEENELDNTKSKNRNFDFKHIRFNFNNSELYPTQQSLDVNYERKLNSYSSQTKEYQEQFSLPNNLNNLNDSISSAPRTFPTINLEDTEGERDDIKAKIVKDNIALNQTEGSMKEKNTNDSIFEMKKEAKEVLRKPCENIKDIKEIQHNFKIEEKKKDKTQKEGRNLKNQVETVKSPNDFKMSVNCISLEIPKSPLQSNNNITVSNITPVKPISSKSSFFCLQDYARYSLYFIVLTLAILFIYLYINRQGSVSTFSLDEIVYAPFVNIASPTDVFFKYWMYLVLIIIIYLLFKKYMHQLNTHYLASSIFEKLKEALKNIYSEENYEHGLTEDQIIVIYSSESNVSQDYFRQNVFPLLKEMRRKNPNIREFEKKENGKYKRAWQWSG